MNEMTLRFYGRFVMVERVGKDGTLTLTFLMPNMTFGGSRFREHHAFMTIPRHAVQHLDKKTTIEPTFRSMTDGPAKEAEDFIWNLAGWDVDLGLTGGVTLEMKDKRELPDLSELEARMKRTATLKGDLSPSMDGIVSAAIHVGGGAGEGRAAFPTHPCVFIPLNGKKPLGKPASSEQIDIIDFTVSVPDEHTLTLTRGDEIHKITVLGDTKPTIALSNLCNELPHEIDLDREFGQYYHVLEVVKDDRLVPKVSFFGGDQDCNRQAKIRVGGDV
jgi:hypothetical protein